MSSMSHKKKIMIFLVIFFAVFSLFLALSSLAYADGSYAQVDVGNLFSAESGESALTSGLSNILSILVTAIILPAGILLSIWRVIYIATFCYMMQTDPLDMLRSNRYDPQGQLVGSWGSQENVSNFFGWAQGDGSPRYQSGKNVSNEYYSKDYFQGTYASGKANDTNSELASRALKYEIKYMVLGLGVTAAVWAILQLIMKFVVMLLDIVGNGDGLLV